MSKSGLPLLLAAAIFFAGAGNVSASDYRVVTSSGTARQCRQVCTNTADCSAITYVRRCINGQCFDFPRQHCAPRRVCERVCN
jgi:hypothetical protein